jgi:hypothetical protein
VGANDESAAAAAGEVNWGVIPDFVEFMLQSADEHDMLEAIRHEIRSSPLGVDPFRSYDENRHLYPRPHLYLFFNSIYLMLFILIYLFIY